MPLSVKDGMGAWIKDFQQSDAPQFKGKSEKERRDMAIAAYMSAKKGDSKDEGYVSMAQQRAVWATRKDGGKGHPDNKKKSKKESVEYVMKHHLTGKEYVVQEDMVEKLQLVGYHIAEKRLPFDPDPKQPPQKNSDGTTTKPMSRAKQLAQLAMRNRKKNEKVEEKYNWKVSHGGKDVHVKAPHAGAAVKKAQKGFGNMDLTKAKVSNLGKVGAPTNEGNHLDELSNDTLRSYHAKAATDLKKKKDQVSKGQLTQKDFKKGQNRVTGLNRAANKMESVELEEMYASTTEPHKDGHRSKVVRTQPNGKTTMSYLGQHVYKSKEHARNAADHIANGMRKGRASDSYIQDFARRHHKEHGMKESVENSVKESNDGYYAYQKAKAKYHKDNPGSNFDRAPEHHKQKYIHPEMQKRGYKKVGSTWVKESVELDEAHAYAKAAKALHDYGTKNGGIDKKDFHTAAKHLDNVGKSGLMQKGNHLAKFNNHLKYLDTDVRDRIHMTLKQHGVMEGTQLDELSPATHKSYQAKAFTSGAKGMAAKRMGTMSAKDAYDNEKKRHAGIELSKSLQRRDARKKRNEEVEEATYGTQAQRLMSPLQKARQDKEKADRDRDGKLKSTALPMRKKNEETVSELKKSTLGSYVNKASKDAASKAYSAASAAKDNNTEKGGKDFSKSMKRLRGINTATKKLAKEDTNEAKSFDQKFKDHLKFATSKSPAVQDYLAKRKANRDAMNKKNDPNAAKKGYALTAVPPERKYQKLQKAKKAGKV